MPSSSQVDFWMRKAREQAGRPVVDLSAPTPSAVRAPRYAQAQAPVQAPRTARRPVHEGAGTCPSCGSGDYSRATPETTPRCFACGYNPRGFINSSSGMVPTTDAPAQSARQIDKGSKFDPRNVVGRIG